MHYLAKKFGEGRQKWNRACIEVGLRPRKQNIQMKTRLI
jgi:hypothetical protein